MPETRYTDANGNGARPVVVIKNGGTNATFGNSTTAITVAPTLDTSAYATGDLLNGTIITFANAVLAVGSTGTINGLVLVDKDVQSKATELWLFDVSTITLPAANAAWSISDADALHCLGVIAFGTTYFASALNSVTNSAAIGLPFKAAAADTSIYGVLITRSNPTYTAAGLQLTLLIAQD